MSIDKIFAMSCYSKYIFLDVDIDWNAECVYKLTPLSRNKAPVRKKLLKGSYTRQK